MLHSNATASSYQSHTRTSQQAVSRLAACSAIRCYCMLNRSYGQMKIQRQRMCAAKAVQDMHQLLAMQYRRGDGGRGGGNGVGAEEQGANGLAGTEMYSAQSSCKPNAVHPMLLCEEKST